MRHCQFCYLYKQLSLSSLYIWLFGTNTCNVSIMLNDELVKYRSVEACKNFHEKCPRHAHAYGVIEQPQRCYMAQNEQ